MMLAMCAQGTTLPPRNSFWQRTRFLLALGLILSLTAAISMTSAWRCRQPAYEGRPLMDWAADLTANDPERVTAAREAVLSLGPRAVPTLIRAIRRPDPILAWPLLEASARWAPATYGTLIRWLDIDSIRGARRHALVALAILGPGAEPAVPALTRLIRRPTSTRNAVEWRQAAYALGRIGPAAAQPLATVFSEAPVSLHAHLLNALADLGPQAVDAIPTVLSAFERKPDSPWAALAQFLRAAGGDKALAHLYPLLADEDGLLRMRINEVLSQIAETNLEARNALIEASTTEPGPVRLELLRLLGRLERLHTAVAHRMLRALDDPDQAMRGEGARWLTRRLSPANLDRLLALEPADLQARARQRLGAGPGLDAPADADRR
ncbi:MAG TPA: hypothetical protein PLY00_15025 [Verrucomicrobiota bacterium]|jgi:hypothetical protein|nr:hypothetical protein [Verrucomicrobiota bacterium]OQC66949.1 MAG: hypothetical protein BWX48_01170 [Verrucomicrobia bacterium ADurb.Bin006]HOA62101.1 hypothetical protein [Verrucomicrobiota bacterium]HOG88164.1 hypothetical protein [Verrucomicrobiota bacterium]HOR72574.1 hypothetical protein [Verrucomicrobiota bacterium]